MYSQKDLRINFLTVCAIDSSNGVSEYLYPQVPVPTYIYIDCNVNFKVLKNREDSSDFDDF